MTKDQEMLEREFLAFHRGVARGLAIASGVRALGEWGRRTGDRGAYFDAEISRLGEEYAPRVGPGEVASASVPRVGGGWVELKVEGPAPVHCIHGKGCWAECGCGRCPNCGRGPGDP